MSPVEASLPGRPRGGSEERSPASQMGLEERNGRPGRGCPWTLHLSGANGAGAFVPTPRATGGGGLRQAPEGDPRGAQRVNLRLCVATLGQLEATCGPEGPGRLEPQAQAPAQSLVSGVRRGLPGAGKKQNNKNQPAGPREGLRSASQVISSSSRNSRGDPGTRLTGGAVSLPLLFWLGVPPSCGKQAPVAFESPQGKCSRRGR